MSTFLSGVAAGVVGVIALHGLQASAKKTAQAQPEVKETNASKQQDDKKGEKKAMGEVQKAFAGGAADVPMEAVYDDVIHLDKFQTNFKNALVGATEVETKLLAARSFLPFAKREVMMNPEKTQAKRAGILEGFKNFAAKRGLDWRGLAAEFEARGMDVWEREKAEVVDSSMPVPDYYIKAGQGTIHSYKNGNCNWPAAFDAPSAYMLVHLHHYPKLTPQEAFDELHRELDHAGIKYMQKGQSDAPLRCIDIGCGVGTSTFSTKKSLDSLNLKAEITGVDLSPEFITVANYRQKEMGLSDGLRFVHGNALNLKPCGFHDGSVDLVMASEVTHEMPMHVSIALMREIARVLRKGGILAYLDLNPEQILANNSVENLVGRLAMSNEPYLDDYLELDMEQTMREAGFEVLEKTWPHREKYPTAVSCSLRMIFARKL